ncbi:MAG: hypothetical protein COU27_00725, partial [Candidatus Levybacteria bacterium CG10_big_fil_rev_8_21_14_0_10_36_7]
IAINKIDKPGANVDRTKTNLLENEIYLEGMGGSVPWVPISAKKGDGVEELLDMMLLVADMEELTGSLDKPASGVVIESHCDTKKGISATLLIKDGSIKSGDFVRAGESVSPVRIMEDFAGKKIDKAQFSSPIHIIGFDKIPQSGETFETFKTKKEAEQSALKQKLNAENSLDNSVKNTAVHEEGAVSIPIILKADVLGSLEAIEHEINKLILNHVEIKTIQKTVGDISEGDIKLALSSQNALIIAFNVNIDNAAKDLATRNNIEIHSFDIIYKLAEWLEKEIKNQTPKIEVEETVGSATILKVFSKNKDKQVVGGKVTSGSIKIGNIVSIIRRDNKVGTGTITNIQQQKTDAKEATEGNEFGAQINSTVEIAQRDEIKSFVIVKK